MAWLCSALERNFSPVVKGYSTDSLYMIDATGMYGLSFDILIAVPPRMGRWTTCLDVGTCASSTFLASILCFPNSRREGGRPTLVFSRPLLTNCMFASCFFFSWTFGGFGITRFMGVRLGW